MRIKGSLKALFGTRPGTFYFVLLAGAHLITYVHMELNNDDIYLVDG